MKTHLDYESTFKGISQARDRSRAEWSLELDGSAFVGSNHQSNRRAIEGLHCAGAGVSRANWQGNTAHTAAIAETGRAGVDYTA